ncbi:hypothetical protein V8F06_003489 [Rhypophila decipiens]
MTNPFQSSSTFNGGDAFSMTGTGMAAPTTQRRSSYANIVSGTTSLRPPRAGALSHMLNPADNDGGLYGRNSYPEFTQTRHDSTDSNSGTWQARLGSGLPRLSSAFEPFFAKEPLLSVPTSEGEIYTNGLPNLSNTGFLSPSYLHGSIYLERLEKEYKARLAAEREGHAVKTQVGAGRTHLPKSKLPSGAHRGVSYELVEKPLLIDVEDEGISPLPSKWNRDDKDSQLEVLGDGYEVEYVGRSQAEHEASAVRADHYMPPQCGVYYFEVLVLHRKREDTTIGIGFSSKSVALTRPPGWEPESWGFHSDDGNIFAAQSNGKPYSDKFGPGDTIGCLLNFREGVALFTRNGRELPTAFRDVNFKDIKGKLYPTIGLKKPGDHILANFGQLPFQFDINSYMKKQKNIIMDNISKTDTSKLAPSLNDTELIQQLVLQFLQHDGYVETARAFAEELHVEKVALSLDPNEHIEGINIKDDEDANNRQRIRRAVLEGDIDQALKYTNAYYPNVLADNEQVYFRLRCRKFIEMIRKEAELNLVLEQRGVTQKHQPRRYYEQEDEEMFDPAAEVDSIGTLSKLSQDALAYGMELRSEFDADPRREISKHLDEIFALIAYPNPLKVKEVAHLLDRAGRGVVAEELNSAILMSLGKSSRAALENLYAQTSVLLEDMRQDGGDGAFVTVQSVIDAIPKPSLV